MHIKRLITNVLRSKSMDWFLYDNGLRHERVNERQWVSAFFNFYFIKGIFLSKVDDNKDCHRLYSVPRKHLLVFSFVGLFL